MTYNAASQLTETMGNPMSRNHLKLRVDDEETLRLVAAIDRRAPNTPPKDLGSIGRQLWKVHQEFNSPERMDALDNRIGEILKEVVASLPKRPKCDVIRQNNTKIPKNQKH
ncbi:MAG TPA: hypothetical protein DCY07_02095 [Rhodospirillaceae bacterium]|nr:hypothetical protein [Rhodospirillaceae bacterium]